MRRDKVLAYIIPIFENAVSLRKFFAVGEVGGGRRAENRKQLGCGSVKAAIFKLNLRVKVDVRR